MKQWRPDVDLARLSAALAEEILAASEQEVRDVAAGSGNALGGAARDARRLIAAAADDQGEADIVIAGGVCFRAPCARQH
jgi:hypothetical protein